VLNGHAHSSQDESKSNGTGLMNGMKSCWSLHETCLVQVSGQSIPGVVVVGGVGVTAGPDVVGGTAQWQQESASDTRIMFLLSQS